MRKDVSTAWTACFSFFIVQPIALGFVHSIISRYPTLSHFIYSDNGNTTIKTFLLLESCAAFLTILLSVLLVFPVLRYIYKLETPELHKHIKVLTGWIFFFNFYLWSLDYGIILACQHIFHVNLTTIEPVNDYINIFGVSLISTIPLTYFTVKGLLKIKPKAPGELV